MRRNAQANSKLDPETPPLHKLLGSGLQPAAVSSLLLAF